jgi:hypothetical protein
MPVPELPKLGELVGPLGDIEFVPEVLYPVVLG